MGDGIMSVIQSLTILAAVAAGVSSGTTFAFSTFVMRALDQLPQDEAIRAMQAINVAAIHPLFLAALIGTGPFVLALAIAQHVNHTSDGLLWAAAAIYIFGVILITIGGNVALNDGLESVTAANAEAGTWSAYARPWTTFNHVRSAAAALTSLLLVYSLAR